jgi:AAA family ATP:ADP antiporter
MKYPMLRSLGFRSGSFFFYFFLVITAYYQVKPASRSLIIEYLGSENLPYIWIIVAISMGIFISFYHRVVSQFSRKHVVMVSTLVFAFILLMFRLWFIYPGKVAAVSFYVFVDILGVVLVEQVWSLANSIYTTGEGKSWYGFLGTGGLLGGITGGGISAFLIKYTPMKTEDLIVSAAVTIFIIFSLMVLMGRLGLFCEVDEAEGDIAPSPVDKGPVSFSKYLYLIAALLLLSQLISPIIEYQFMNSVESAYGVIDARTAFLSLFFSALSLVSIGINLFITPTIHRFLGPIAGLLAQPLVIMFFSFIFLFNGTLFFAGAVKIGDRGLSYSINRASRELLYVPIGSLLIYRAKAWIDMLGYRLFKVLGSAVILIITGITQVSSHLAYLSLITILICVVWLSMVAILGKEYRLIKVVV